MSRECPVCNSDVPADGRCCNVKCEAYSHRVLDEIKDKGLELFREDFKSYVDNYIDQCDKEIVRKNENVLEELHMNIKIDGETIPININDIGLEAWPELKQKKQEIDKLHSEIVEAQKEFGKHTIYKKEFTNTDEVNEIGRQYIDPCNTLVHRINQDITKQAFRDAKIDTESKPVTAWIDKWIDGEMYYQLPKDTRVTYDYYLTDSVTIEAPEYSWYLHFESGDKVRLSDNEAYKMMENGVPDKVNLTYDRVGGEDE